MIPDRKNQDALEAARDLCMHGIALGKEGKREAALVQYASVIAQFGNEQDTEFLKVLAAAMFNTGTTLAALDRSEESVIAYDALIKKFQRHVDPTFQLYVVKAMMNKAYRLNALLKNDDAIAAYEAVIADYGTSQDPETVAHLNSVKSFLAERRAVLDARAQSSA
jgi:tetratricopeptide (TPR) repeat protein